MVGTIVPIVHRERPIIAANILLLHAVGYVLSASAVGDTLAFIGNVLGVAGHERVNTCVLSIMCLLGALNESGIITLPLPQCRRQVSVRWRRRFNYFIMAFLYGLGLGVGISTRIIVSSVYVLLASCLLIGKPLMAVFVMSGFGFGRCLPVLWLSQRRFDDQFAEISWSALQNLSGIRLVNGFLLSAAAGVGIARLLERQ